MHRFSLPLPVELNTFVFVLHFPIAAMSYCLIRYAQKRRYGMLYPHAPVLHKRWLKNYSPCHFRSEERRVGKECRFRVWACCVNRRHGRGISTQEMHSDEA